MNKTISVNISGFVFNIEEQAYEQLGHYLDNIRTNFHNEEERDEIMSDIELRIAELFQEKIAPNKEVIISDDIAEVIAILGHPEDFASDEDRMEQQEEPTSKKITDTPNAQSSKRLFRDKDGGTIGGVCSGLGYYFEVDPVIFRVIFVLLFILFGSGVLLYIILLLVVPEAKTTSDKIEMKGQSVNVESIKDHVSNIKQTVSESASHSNIRNNIKDALNKGAHVGYSTFQIISKVMGVLFALGGTIFFVFLMLIIFGNTGILPFIGPDRIESIPTLIEIIYPGENPSSLIFISFLVVVTIPIISIILIGIRVLFNYKENAKKIGWGLTILWVVAASTLFVFSVELASDLKSDKVIRYDIPYTDTTSNELIVEVMNDDEFSNHIDPYDDWGTELIKVDDAYIYFGLPDMSIRASSDSGDFQITLIKRSHGESTRDAIEKIEHIDYPISMNGNKIFIPPYMKMPRQDKMRAQYVRVEIVVPSGKTITFGKNIDRILRYLESGDDHWNESYANTKWTNERGIFSKSGSESLPMGVTFEEINDETE